MEEIIKLLYNSKDDKLNYKAVEMARNNKGKINDYLLNELEKINNDIDNKKIEYTPLFFDYAIYLLAEFRDKRLYPLLMKLLDKEGIDSFNFFGVGVMDKLPSIVVSVYDGDISLINRILENDKVDGYTKNMLIKTYIYFYENKIISEEEFETYIRKLIKIYKDKDDDLTSDIPIIVSSAHLFNLINDVKEMFDNEMVDLMYNGDFDTFVDDIFNYSDNYKKIDVMPIEDMFEQMAFWYSSDDKKKSNIDVDNMLSEYKKKNEEEMNEIINKYNKVGRNDLCPCGSGKKYKKCCIDKEKFILPYQGYIDKELNKYPKDVSNEDEVSFYDFYNKEYIEIDKLLYKALKYIPIPVFINRNKTTEDTIKYNYLKKAYSLIKEVISKNNFKTIEEYDDEASIHYSLYLFFEKYSELIINRISIDKKLYLEELEELLNYFYDNFDISDKKELVFLDRKSVLYKLSNRYEEGIKFYEGKLKTSKYNRFDIYEYLFYEYQEYYDYNDVISKMENMIDNEKDKEIKEFLEEMKLDYMEC